MAIRKIQAPGIELNEIDRSSYENKVDNSIVGTTSLLIGFADKGRDMEVTYVNSMNTFVNTYGNPKNEAEKYFYNGAYEVLNRGGRLYCAKLPYDNESYNMFPFTTYTVDYRKLNTLSSPYETTTSNVYEKKSMYDFMLDPRISYNFIERIISEDGLSNIYLDGMDCCLITENGSGEVDFCKYCTDNGIYLSVIGDMFDFISEKVGFSFYCQTAIDSVFRDAKGRYKNESVYMLKELMDDVSSFISANYSVVSSNADISTQLIQMSQDMNNYGSVEELKEQFGKGNCIGYYLNYMNSLSSVVQNVSVESSYGPAKDLFVDIIGKYMQNDVIYKDFQSIRQYVGNANTYIELHSNTQSKEKCGLMSLSSIDRYQTKEDIPNEGDIVIVDITRYKYAKDMSIDETGRQYIGILPVVTTAANALAYQKIVQRDTYVGDEYVTVSCIQNNYTQYSEQMISSLNNEKQILIENKAVGFTQNIGSENNVTDEEETLSRVADSYFPKLTFSEGIVDSDNLKKIGIVVFKMYVDTSNSKKISFVPVESFVGSLNKHERDTITNSNVFIDNIVNANSSTIRVYSNVKFQENDSKGLLNTDKASMFLIREQTATSLGLYKEYCADTIGLKMSIQKPIDTILDSLKDPNRYRIDIVVDGGVSNIAQFINQMYRKDQKGRYVVDNGKSNWFDLSKSGSINIWKNIIDKYDNFCKYTRKDCMFIADGPRNLCLIGNEKRVRNTKPENTIENTVLKDMKYMSGFINSSYGAGYCDWFKSIEHSSGDYFWCPPSIKAAGIYTYTDAYSSFWMAPAGMNRGRLPSDVVDCAFSPTLDQAGTIYNNNWNYAVNYPIDGIVMEGQRTFQKNKTAMDRVNVRRLCLGIEKVIKHISKFFNYEQNTEWLRTRFKDSISNYLEEVRTGDGISEYVVICDNRNNNIQTIENNELHITVAIKPIKCVEFIVVGFILTNQSANVTEIAQSEM